MNIEAPIAIDSVASVPWKNGGGTTRELAARAASATANDFLWRVSIARIDAPGDFSMFPGVDRTILLWRGDGVVLRSPAWPDRKLDDPRAPFKFRGEDEVVCDLMGGPTQDLNLMVRRGQAGATFEIITGAEHAVPECEDLILLCASGSAQFVASANGEVYDLGADQFLRASEIRESEAAVLVNGDALLIAIAISDRGRSPYATDAAG